MLPQIAAYGVPLLFLEPTEIFVPSSGAEDQRLDVFFGLFTLMFIAHTVASILSTFWIGIPGEWGKAFVISWSSGFTYLVTFGFFISAFEFESTQESAGEVLVDWQGLGAAVLLLNLAYIATAFNSRTRRLDAWQSRPLDG